MKRYRKTLLWIALSIVYFITLVSLTIVNISSSMHYFDHPELEIPAYHSFLSSFSQVLMEPSFTLLKTIYPRSGIPNSIEWLALIVNSGLWGLAFTVIVIALRRRFRAKATN